MRRLIGMEASRQLLIEIKLKIIMLTSSLYVSIHCPSYSQNSRL